MKPNHINRNRMGPKKRSVAVAIPLKDLSYDEFFAKINKSYPIKIDPTILSRIHKDYPLLSVSEVAMILRSCMEVIREHMIKGYKINIRYIFNDTHIEAKKNAGQNPYIKIKHRTPPTIRKKES